MKKNEGFAYHNLLDNRKSRKPKFKIHDLVRTADSTRTFSNGDTTNWSFKLYEITKINNDTIPSYRKDDLPERRIEALVKKTKITLKQKDGVMKILSIT